MDYNGNMAGSPGVGGAPMPGYGDGGFGGVAVEEAKSAKKSKKWLFYVIGGVALLAVIAVVLVLVLGGGGAKSSEVKNSVVSALIDEDGTAYLPLMNGKSITIKGEIARAAITADRKHVIVLDEDGNLYITDQNQSKKTKLSDEADNFFAVKDTGFFFAEGDLYCRYSFKEDAIVELGKVYSFTTARDSLSVLFSTEDGKIYTLPYNAEEPERVGASEGNIRLRAISNDGTISVWSVRQDGEITIFLNEGEERTTLGKVNASYDYTYATFSEDQQLLVISNSYGEQLWLKRPGEEPVRVKLGAEPYSSAVFTENGYLTMDKGAKLSSIYFSTEANKGINVYCIGMEGERERVLSGVYSYYIADGHIFYLDSDNDLYCAKIKGEKISDEEKIAGDVNLFEVSINGKYVYYIKDYDRSDEAGTLYCYKVGAKEPVKVSGDVACWAYSDNTGGYLIADISTDGSSIYFFKELDDISSSYSEQGTLTVWSYKSGERTKITGDVITYTLDSGTWTGEINPKGFVFLKNGSADSNGSITADMYYYDGKEAVKIASEVLK